jgi:hypothetical protein
MPRHYRNSVKQCCHNNNGNDSRTHFAQLIHHGNIIASAQNREGDHAETQVLKELCIKWV